MRRSALALVPAILLGLSLPRSAWAQGPPIHTDTPMMLGLEGRGVRTYAKYIYVGRFPKIGMEDDVTIIPRYRILVFPLAVPYNLFSDRFQVGIVAPFMRVRRMEIAREQTGAGIGDVRLFAKYLLLQHDRPQETFRIATKVSLKLPTGTARSVPVLGSGSTDVAVSAVAGWIKQRTGVYLEGIYQFRGRFGNLRYGNVLLVNLALGHRFLPPVYRRYPSPQINGFLEINGEFTARSRIDGVEQASSGGALVLFSPGIQYVGGRRWLIEASWQWPIIHQPNGLQPVLSWQFLVGTRVLLF